MTLASGDPIFSLVVHQPTVQSFCPQIQGSQYGAYVGEVEDMMCVAYVSVAKGA